MSLFGRSRERGQAAAHPTFLPADIVARVEKHGKERYHGDNDPFDPDMWSSDYIHELRALSRDEQEKWVSALAAAVLPVGGWAVYGAEELLMSALGPPGHITGHGEIVEAALEFQRAGGVWWNALSPAEQVYWTAHHPDASWLEPRDPPSRDEVKITPLSVGEERKLSSLTR